MPELLIVDGDRALRRSEERLVCDQGYSCQGTGDASSVRERLQRDSYKLVLLDVDTPGEAGMELLSHIRSSHPEVAVLMVTGEDSTKLAMAAIEHGAYGYLVKPIGAGELLINVATALHRRRLELDSGRLVRRLRATVEERSHNLQKALQDLEGALQDLEVSESKVWVSQAETVFRLARMVEFRDEETGHHLQRMSHYCEILARHIGFSAQRCELLRLSSQLHDVGKVAISDSILLKQGKLTGEEIEIIKSHAETGFKMLAGSSSELVQMGALIAHTHHERWDGSGYPCGLAGDEIPVEGRIAAVADVFDALTSDRVYRSALPVKSAIEMMLGERGHHFEPDLLDAFFAELPEIKAIRQTYAD